MKGCNKNKPEMRLHGLKFGCVLKSVFCCLFQNQRLYNFFTYSILCQTKGTN